jgi:hypothetical protein
MSASLKPDLKPERASRPFRMMDALALLFFMGMAFTIARHFLSDWRKHGKPFDLTITWSTTAAAFQASGWQPNWWMNDGNRVVVTLEQEPPPSGYWLVDWAYSGAINAYFTAGWIDFSPRPIRLYSYRYLPNFLALVFYVPTLLSPLLGMGSLAVALMHFLPPGTPRPRLRRQPGAVASLTVAVAMNVLLVFWCLFLVLDLLHAPIGFDPWFLVEGRFQRVYFRLLPFLGLSVAVAWAFLIASGAWRAQRSWLDRLGRALGWGWIACTPFYLWISMLVA